VTDLWSERAQAFRDSPAHRAGADLDLVVEWCEPGPGVTALDVASGGGHVARRLREAGCAVVTVDPAPGMRAEDLPFADDSFDVVACRIAPHHFGDVAAAVRELARVARDRVVVQDNLFMGEEVEEAERLRDPTHVRCYTEEEWRQLFADAGLRIEDEEVLERERDVGDWLARVDTPERDAERVRTLLADRVADGRMTFRTLVLKGRKR